MGMIGDFYVRLSAVTAPYTKSLIEAGDEGEAFAEANKTHMEAVEASNESGGASFGLLGKAAVGIGAAFIGVSAISMKWATSFQSAMESVHTQAGVAQSQIGSLSNGVLDLAGKVGFSPDSLAEALYHIESSFASVGITGPKALNLLQIAAEGAATGHANLVDVTNALDAAVASGIPGVQNFSQAMGVLNATVGSGDMEMQDLANAFSTGVLANVKSYGLSITDVGAALATFGDNNIRGQNAATELRMAVQALAVPANSAATYLDKMGLSADSFGKVMSKQGLLPALELLKTKMTALGVSESQQGQVLTDMFGKKAGAGIVVLYDQLDRLKSKYPELAKGANQFGNDWIATKATVKQQLNEIGAGIQAAGIKFGQFLLPLVSKGLGAAMTQGQSLFGSLSKDFSQLTSGWGSAATQTAAPANYGHAGLNQVAAHVQPPPLTGWQKVGATLQQIASDFVTFGKDAVKATTDLKTALTPTAEMLGKVFLGALKTVGSILANQVGPALEAVAAFFDKHKQVIEDFAKVTLALLAVKLGALGTVKAATGVVGLANSILSFPKGQLDQITGAMGKLKTAWLGSAGDGGEMVGGLKNTLTSMYNTMRGGVRTMAGWGKQIGGAAAGGLKSAGGSIAEAASSWGGKISGAVRNVMPTKLDAKLFLQSVKDVGANAAITIAGWGSNIADAASSAASGLATLAKNSATAVASFASSAWSSATGALSGIATSIGEAAAAAWGWVTATAASAVEAGRAAIAWTADKLALIGTAIAEKAAAAAQWLLDAAMDANPVGLIVIAITALIGIFVVLWTKCAWFRDFWRGLWADIRKLFDSAVSFIRTHLVLVASLVLLPIAPLILLATHWKQVWADIKNATAAAWRWVDSNVVQPVVRVFTQDIPAALRALGQWFSNVWTGIKITVSNVWHWVDSNILQPAAHFFSAVLGGALTTAQKLWNSFWGGVQKVVQTVWNVVQPILNTIQSAINGVSSALSKVSGAVGAVQHVGGSIVHDLNPLNWDEGGWVPGAKGSPVFGVVHGGEYVLSADMIAGRAPIDNRALTGVLSAQTGTGSGSGNSRALAVTAPGSSGSVTVINVNVQVAGNVTSERKLADTIRTQILQYNLRNSSNGLSLA